MYRIFLLLSLISSIIIAQNNQSTTCICCDKNHSQFDFWVGDWAVYDTLNNLVGTNKIIKKLDSCLIHENWISQGKNRGTSFNYYDPIDSTWNQLWIDNQGTILKLKGNLINGKMILKSELQKGKKVDWYYNRITWSKIDSGFVKQSWDVLDKRNNILTNLFTGIYKPKE